MQRPQKGGGATPQTKVFGIVLAVLSPAVTQTLLTPIRVGQLRNSRFATFPAEVHPCKAGEYTNSTVASGGASPNDCQCAPIGLGVYHFLRQDKSYF